MFVNVERENVPAHTVSRAHGAWFKSHGEFQLNIAASGSSADQPVPMTVKLKLSDEEYKQIGPNRINNNNNDALVRISVAKVDGYSSTDQLGITHNHGSLTYDKQNRTFTFEIAIDFSGKPATAKLVYLAYTLDVPLGDGTNARTIVSGAL